MTYQYKPDCFPKHSLYKEWVFLAKIVREVVSPCDDCTKTYEHEMLHLGRCNRMWVESNLQIGGKSKVLTQGVLE